MASDKKSRKWLFYKCGWCGDDINYAQGTPKPNPCPNCGWTHLERSYNDVPSEVRVSLNDS